MILYRLVCTCDHEFDQWFDNMADYDARRDSGAVTCPECGGVDVSKAIMAPKLAGAGPGSDGAVGTIAEAPSCATAGPACGGCPALN